MWGLRIKDSMDLWTQTENLKAGEWKQTKTKWNVWISTGHRSIYRLLGSTHEGSSPQVPQDWRNNIFYLVKVGTPWLLLLPSIPLARRCPWSGLRSYRLSQISCLLSTLPSSCQLTNTRRLTVRLYYCPLAGVPPWYFWGGLRLELFY